MEDELSSLGGSHDAVAFFTQNKTNSTQDSEQKEMKVSRKFLSYSLNERILSFVFQKTGNEREDVFSQKLGMQICIYDVQNVSF